MNSLIPVVLVVEGQLDEAVLIEIINKYASHLLISMCLGKRGKEYIKSKINDFNKAAKKHNYIVLVDLDNEPECAPSLIDEWVMYPRPKFTFRVAVREIETWLLADRDNLAKYMSVLATRIPVFPEALDKPKLDIIKLARRSKKSVITDDIVPDLGSTSKIGKNYNPRLVDFIRNYWDIEAARLNSDSLDRCIKAIQKVT